MFKSSISIREGNILTMEALTVSPDVLSRSYDRKMDNYISDTTACNRSTRISSYTEVLPHALPPADDVDVRTSKYQMRRLEHGRAKSQHFESFIEQSNNQKSKFKAIIKEK
jgi:hypothetical protein